MTVFLPLSTQENIFIYFNIIFIIATTLSVIGLFFLIKQTPPNQSTIRNYLIAIQILLLIGDIHFDIGFHPIPLFPVLAGYAVGYLVQLGFSIHLELSITIAFYIWIGMAIVMCILFRHQTFFRDGNIFKLKSRTIRVIQFSLVLLPSVLDLIYAFNGKDAETVERFLIEEPHNVSWIRDRGSYYLEKRTPILVAGMISVICVLITGATVVISMFVHMFRVLRQDSALHSEQSLKAIQRSLTALFLQLVIPFFLFIVPTVTIFISLVTETLISFEVTLFMFLILPCHSVGHNLILLTNTPTYRKIIVNTLKGIATCRWELQKEAQHRQSTVVI